MSKLVFPGWFLSLPGSLRLWRASCMEAALRRRGPCAPPVHARIVFSRFALLCLRRWPVYSCQGLGSEIVRLHGTVRKVSPQSESGARLEVRATAPLQCTRLAATHFATRTKRPSDNTSFFLPRRQHLTWPCFERKGVPPEDQLSILPAADDASAVYYRWWENRGPDTVRCGPASQLLRPSSSLPPRCQSEHAA